MTTLLTHEWLHTRGPLLTIAGIAALLVALGALLSATGLVLLSAVGAFLALGVVLALVPVVQVFLAFDYWRVSYGRVGYFTQTLPIRGSRIYAAKLLWAWLATLGALLVALALAMAAWPGIARGLGAPETNPFTVASDLWGTATAAAPTSQVVLALTIALALLLLWPVQYFFAASIGSEAPRNRLGAGGPVLTWVGLYVVVQVAAVLGLFLVPWAIGPAQDGLGVVPFNAWSELTAGETSQDVFPLGVLPPIFLVTLVCLWRTVRSWDHRVSLV